MHFVKLCTLFQVPRGASCYEQQLLMSISILCWDYFILGMERQIQFLQSVRNNNIKSNCQFLDILFALTYTQFFDELVDYSRQILKYTCKKKMHCPKSELAMQNLYLYTQHLMVIMFLEYIYRITVCVTFQVGDSGYLRKLHENSSSATALCSFTEVFKHAWSCFLGSLQSDVFFQASICYTWFTKIPKFYLEIFFFLP